MAARLFPLPSKDPGHPTLAVLLNPVAGHLLSAAFSLSSLKLVQLLDRVSHTGFGMSDAADI